jgi:hypothetical protein
MLPLHHARVRKIFQIKLKQLAEIILENFLLISNKVPKDFPKVLFAIILSFSTLLPQ